MEATARTTGAQQKADRQTDVRVEGSTGTRPTRRTQYCCMYYITKQLDFVTCHACLNSRLKFLKPPKQSLKGIEMIPKVGTLSNQAFIET